MGVEGVRHQPKDRGVEIRVYITEESHNNTVYESQYNTNDTIYTGAEAGRVWQGGHTSFVVRVYMISRTRILFARGPGWTDPRAWNGLRNTCLVDCRDTLCRGGAEWRRQGPGKAVVQGAIRGSDCSLGSEIFYDTYIWLLGQGF